MGFSYKENIPALHEASHAVVAWLIGAIIHVLTIVGPLPERESLDKRTPFFCKFQLPSVLSSHRVTPEDINKRLFIDFAPCAVMEKICGETGSLNDIVDLIKFLTWPNRDEIIKSLIGDAQQAIDGNPDNWDSAALQFYKQHNGPVKELINQSKVLEATKALAQILSVKGQLSGSEVVHFLEQLWEGPLPEKAKPANEHSTGFRGGGLKSTLTSVSRLIELVRPILDECKPENEFEVTILEKAHEYVLGPLFKIKELECITNRVCKNKTGANNS